MLRRKVPGSFVCLQCRLQLGAVAPRRHFQASAATAHRRRPDPKAGLDHQEAIEAFRHFARGEDAESTKRARSQPESLPPSSPERQGSIKDAVARSVDDDAPKDQDDNNGRLYRITKSSNRLTRAHEQKAYDAVGIPPLLADNDVDLGQFYRRTEVSEDGGKLLKAREVYKSRGKHLSAEKERLSVDVMGKPSSAIILRSRRSAKSKSKKTKQGAGKMDAENAETLRKVEEPVADSLEADVRAFDKADAQKVRLTDILESEATYLTLGDAIHNINELRPMPPQPLPANEFAELQQKLENGFTVAQLQQYVTKFDTLPPPSRAGDQSQGQCAAFQAIDPSWIVEKKPWVPAGPEAEEVGDPAQWYIHKSMSPRERLAVRIMRECWGLSSDRTLGVRGRLDVKLADTEFGLLLVGTRKWLRDIARHSLGAGNQIEALGESNTISILAPKAAAESILMELNTILSHTRTTTIDTRLFSDQPLDAEVVEDVARLTNTLIHLDPTRKQIVVSWIDLPEQPKGVENLGDVVLRLLLDAFLPKPRTSSDTTLLSPPNTGRARGFVPMFDCEPQLPWHERRKQWARWTTPIEPTDKKLKKETKSLRLDLLPYPIEVKEWDASRARQPGNPFANRNEPLKQGGWSSAPITQTRAVFGYVLHEQPADTGFQIKKRYEQHPRTFIPVLPPISALELPSNLAEEGLWHSTLVLRFIPDPQSNLPAGSIPPPPLELRIEADHKELKRIISLRVVTSSSSRDVLLPTSPVDVRLLQERFYSLPGATINEHVPAVLDFLNNSDLRPWDRTLVTPALLPGVRLPRRLVETDAPPAEPIESAAETSTESPPSPSPSSEDFLPLDYRFAGLEILRTISAEYEGFKLSYQSTQAGKYTSKTAQISLTAEAIPESALATRDPSLVEDNTTRKRHNSTAAPEEEKLDAAAFMGVVSRMVDKVALKVNGKGRFGWEVKA